MTQPPVLAAEATFSLRDTAVKRSVYLPLVSNLQEVHLAIQGTFGWHDAHLYEFQLQVLSGTRIYTEAENFHTLDIAPSESYLIGNLPIGTALTYVYDLGDRWTIDVTFSTCHVDLADLYTCSGAVGVAPPEDAGGIHGYHHKLQTLKTGTREEAAETRKWFKFMRHNPNATVTVKNVNRAWNKFNQGLVGPDHSVYEEN